MLIVKFFIYCYRKPLSTLGKPFELVFFIDNRKLLKNERFEINVRY